MTRINKYLASRTDYSRRAAEELVLNSRVKVNGKVIDDLSFKVQENDEVYLDDILISDIEIKNYYYAFNKPKYVISAVKDDRGRRVVSDFFDKNLHLFPVGRLDYESTGLIIMTNDGDMANKIIHPGFNITKVYMVKLNSHLTSNQMREFEIGIDLEDGKTFPAKIDIYDYVKKIYRVEISEGRNRQIRRMMQFFKKEVIELERISVGKIKLGKLKEGKYRKLSNKEMEFIKNI